MGWCWGRVKSCNIVNWKILLEQQQHIFSIVTMLQLLRETAWIWSSAAAYDLYHPSSRAIHTRICSFSKLLFITHRTEQWIPVGRCSFQSAALDTVSKNQILVPFLFPQEEQKEEVNIALFCFFVFQMSFVGIINANGRDASSLWGPVDFSSYEPCLTFA